MPGVLLARTYEAAKGKPDPTGWWLSEKLDGMRLFWDGHGGLWTRNGKPVYAPPWWLSSLPADLPLDGEAWTGRGAFRETISIVRAHKSREWARVRFCVLDALNDSTLPFEERRREIVKRYAVDDSNILIPSLIPASEGDVVTVVPHVRCAGRDALIEAHQRVVAVGGEGVMLREPRSPYAFKRSSSLLKLKHFHDDEACVVDHIPGEGRLAGMVGALACETRNGVRFSVGSGMSDIERTYGSDSLPAIGSIITYRYFELSPDGVPRFPTLLGIAIDKSWP